MMRTSDPLERLRAVNPVPPATVERLRPDADLFRAIVSERPVERRPAPRRRRVLVPGLVVSSLLGGAVAYAVLRDGVPKPQTVACYAEADLEAHTATKSVGSEGPLAACAEVWRRGDLGSGGTVPPLVECVLPTGVVGVFPARAGTDVCAGVVPRDPTTSAPPPTLAEVNDRFLAFRDAVLPRFLETACMDPRAGSDLVRAELDRVGLADWRVRSGDFSPDRPCATLSFRPEAQEVVLTPSTPRR